MKIQQEISSLAACLGYLDGDNYKKEPDCLGHFINLYKKFK